MDTCDALRCLRPTDQDEAAMETIDVLICAATHDSPAEYETRVLHAVCLAAARDREAADEGRRHTARCRMGTRDVS